MAEQMNDALLEKRALTAQEMAARALRGHSPALTWLSLVGLLRSRAQLRFARQRSIILQRRGAWLKIDKSAYRLPLLKIDKSAYRVEVHPGEETGLDKSEHLV